MQATDMDRLRNVLNHLEKAKKSGRGWIALCPAHDDSTPSMTLAWGEEGKLLVNCHRGCDPNDIVKAMGLEMSDLFPDKIEKKDEIEAVYSYVDENGEVIYQVVRYRLADGRKDFRQRKPDGAGGWIWSASGVRKPLYKLPEVNQAILNEETIYVVEGEKDVESLNSLGYTATTSGGAGSWKSEHTKALASARVVIIPDHDGPGYRHALQIADDLEDIAEHVRVVAPPPSFNDTSDAIKAGLSPTQFEPFNLVEAIDGHDPYRNVLSELKDLGRKDSMSFEQKINRAQSLLARTMVDERLEEFGRLTKWEPFLAGPVEDYDWVIPNLIEKGERVIVVAAEGVGKTMLARQMALMTAAGLHPFTKAKIPPKRTLFVDLENPEKIIRRTSKKILDSVRLVTQSTAPIEAHLLVKPDGMDLLDERDLAELEQVIEATEPDIIFLGPLYKAYVESGKDNMQTIKRVVMTLDHLRDTYGVAWWLEHHAPLGSDSQRTLRPVDSGVWSRWPEFGVALQPDPTATDVFEVKHFRGQRDVRQWPRELQKGGQFPFTANF